MSDSQGPLVFVRKNNGPRRNIAHILLEWDKSIHNQVDKSVCGNGNGLPCETLGYVRHLGHKFGGSQGLPITAASDISGLSGGYGWFISFIGNSPRSLSLTEIEIDPDSPLILRIPYPQGTTFQVTAKASQWCNPVAGKWACEIGFAQVSTVDAVYSGAGNVFHVDSTGVLTVRVVSMAQNYVGNPNWLIPDWNTPNRANNNYALRRFERNGIRLPEQVGNSLHIQATCPDDTASSPKDGYCTGSQPINRSYNPDVCPPNYTQVAYDKCCDGNGLNCVTAF